MCGPTTARPSTTGARLDGARQLHRAQADATDAKVRLRQRDQLHTAVPGALGVAPGSLFVCEMPRGRLQLLLTATAAWCCRAQFSCVFGPGTSPFLADELPQLLQGRRSRQAPASS